MILGARPAGKAPGPSPGPSLGSRLSAWLAVQGLAAAVIVSAAVYGVTAWSLQGRQDEELRLKSEVILNALNETADPADLVELKHRLDKFLAGHENMSIGMTAADGSVLYASHTMADRSRSKAMRTERLTLDWPRTAGQRVLVELKMDVGPDDALLRRLAAALLIVSLAGSAIVSATGWWLVRRALAPVRDLAAQVESIALDRPGSRLDGSAQARELRPLVDRFNALLARVELAVLQLEAFNADVAHELRTPLTTLIGASELALRRERPAHELSELIAANLDDLRRLGAIVNDMLFLSQADRGARARRSPVPSLATALASIVEFHDAALQERALQASIDGDAAGAFDMALLRRAMSNLLANATRYAEQGSRLTLGIERVAGRVRISVCNGGTEIGPQHLARLFDRFYRVESSRRHSDANHGLGLAIVAAIARMHGGEPFARSAGGTTTIGLEIAAADD